jgi:hypothetical protein
MPAAFEAVTVPVALHAHLRASAPMLSARYLRHLSH